MKRGRKAARSEDERLASEVWYRLVTRRGVCVVCGKAGRLQSHHVLPQQFLRRLARDLGVEAARLLWDERNGLALCVACHAGHHSRLRPIRRDVLPRPAFEFARRWGCGWKLDRLYPA